MNKGAVLAVLVFFCSGCSAMVENVEVHPGMSKDQVAVVWGSPRAVQNAHNNCCKLPHEEAWMYFNDKYQTKKHKKYVLFKDDVVHKAYVWKK